MRVTFQNLTLTIVAKDPKEAYRKLVRLMDHLTVEAWESDTYSTDKPGNEDEEPRSTLEM